MYILRGVLQWLQSPALNSKGAPRALVRHMPGAPGTGELLNGVTHGQPKIPGSKKVSFQQSASEGSHVVW